MVNKKEILKHLGNEKERMGELGVKRVGLFGSFAKGKQKKDSDIDILVSFENKDYGNQYFQLLFLLEDLFRKKIDLIPIETLRRELNYVKKEALYVEVRG